MYAALSSLYGQLRGYGRLRIRRQVRQNADRSAAELAATTRDLFQHRVHEAIRRFPAYAEKVRSACGGLPAARKAIKAAKLPIWTRADQRDLFERLEGPPVPQSFVHSTGGSTGVPLRFYVSRESFEWRCAVSDRGYSWAGAAEGRKSFYVWGTPIRTPALRQRIKADLHHRLQRRTYFDSFEFGDEEKRRCCAAIDRQRPPAIVGYAGNLIELARYVRDNAGVLTWKAQALVTAAEGLVPGQRELIEAHLGGRVFMSYGSREFMLIGMECAEHYGYHIAADNLMVEVVNADGHPAAPEETGRILITDLHNDANPFVRYEIGDWGSMMPDGFRCPCGRPFPVLATVEGRVQEVILTPGGQRVTALFVPHLMKEFAWVEGYQIAQSDPASVTLNLVTRQELTSSLTDPLEGQLQKKLGAAMQIRFRKVERLERSRTGKTPIVVQAAAAS
jgi:phenylacetate-CoA ligase